MNSKAFCLINVGIILLAVLSPIQITKNAQSESPETIFGINYVSTHWHYDPSYLSEEELNRDFSLFETQGIEIVILPVIWKYIEPTKGQYNEAAFTDLKRVCAAAETHGLKVIIDVHTLMKEDSWTMPDWLSPKRFQTIFTDSDVRAAWLMFLSNTANNLKDIPNLHSWHMMNEPYRTFWACDVSIDDFLVLWGEMKTAIRQFSDKPVSIRFAEDSLSKSFHFNHDPRIYDLLDYVALNWYENHSTVENLTATVADIRSYGREVMISEFGYNSTDDSLQREKVTEYVNLFESLNIPEVSSWFWRADNDAGPPALPETEFNMAKDALGTPRPAFYALRLPKTIVVDDNGPADFTRIQDAVDRSITGDTIIVKAGIYNEDVTVNGFEYGRKDIRLVGEDRKSIVNGIVSIGLSDVTISNFTITSGIDMSYASLNIYDNTIQGLINVPMHSGGPCSANIINNTIENNGLEIMGEGYVYNNYFINCDKAIYGGQYIVATNNTIINSNYAFDLFGRDYSSYLFINGNTVMNCDVFLKWSINSSIFEIELIGNNITQCNYGLFLDTSEQLGTEFIGFNCFNNNFNDITTNVYVSELFEVAQWNSAYPQGGNYWSNYLDQDLYSGPNQNQPGSDGVGDHPYIIPNAGQDNYPLVYPYNNGVTFFKDSYETGINKFSGTTITTGETANAVTTTPHHGSCSGYFTSNGGGGTENAYSYKTFPSTPEVYTRGYFRVSKSGIADDSDRFYFTVLKSATGSNLAYAGWRRTAGVTRWCLVVRNDAGYTTKYSTSSPALNKWYNMELHWVNGNPGLGELYIDGEKVCSATSNTARYGDAARANFGLTEIYNCASTSAYADCVQISTGHISPEPPSTVSISSSQSTGSTSNLGSATFDGVTSNLPRDFTKPAGYSFSTLYTPSTGYSFDHWEAVGYLKISSTTSNPATVTVTGDCSLKAIYKTASSASLTVITPNTAESWVRGTAHTLRWTSTGSPGANVKIELLKGGMVNRVISPSTPNDGSYRWTIPATQTLGTDYKIRITSTTNTAITDSSNSNFSIKK